MRVIAPPVSRAFSEFSLSKSVTTVPQSGNGTRGDGTDPSMQSVALWRAFSEFVIRSYRAAAAVREILTI